MPKPTFDSCRKCDGCPHATWGIHSHEYNMCRIPTNQIGNYPKIHRGDECHSHHSQETFCIGQKVLSGELPRMTIEEYMDALTKDPLPTL